MQNNDHIPSNESCSNFAFIREICRQIATVVALHEITCNCSVFVSTARKLSRLSRGALRDFRLELSFKQHFCVDVNQNWLLWHHLHTEVTACTKFLSARPWALWLKTLYLQILTECSQSKEIDNDRISFGLICQCTLNNPAKLAVMNDKGIDKQTLSAEVLSCISIY